MPVFCGIAGPVQLRKFTFVANFPGRISGGGGGTADPGADLSAGPLRSPNAIMTRHTAWGAMTNNLVQLDLSRFSRSDIAKIENLGQKLRLMHRWFRFERREEDTGDGGDGYLLYSGDRGPRNYVSYGIHRLYDGAYELRDPRRKTVLASARSIDEVIDALPEDFFYTGAGR
jgi:hypothetical protein